MADALDERRNALNVLRLGLALLVIVDHTAPLGGFGHEPRLGQTSVGSLAVAGFFALSGYLIASSRTRTDAPRFAWHRFLRIFPGYWLVLLVVAFGFAPAAWIAVHGSLSGYGLVRPLHYVAQNIPLVTPRAAVIPGTLQHVPQPGAWNTSLWTLQWELACYAGVLVLARFGLLDRARRARVAGGLGVLVAIGVADSLVALPAGATVAIVTRFAATFLAGTVLFLYADRVPFDGRLAAGAAALLAAGSLLPRAHAGIALPLAYLCLWAGARWRTDLCRRTDISYGVYIYAFPVMQTLALHGVQRHGELVYLVASVVATLPFAYASFVLVERPAMRLRHLHRPPLPVLAEPVRVAAAS